MAPWLGKRAHRTLLEVVVKLCIKMSIQMSIFYYPPHCHGGGDTRPCSQQAGTFSTVGIPRTAYMNNYAFFFYFFFFPECFFLSRAVALAVPCSTGLCGAIHHS